jgi:hypothetical protein
MKAKTKAKMKQKPRGNYGSFSFFANFCLQGGLLPFVCCLLVFLGLLLWRFLA